MRVNHFVTAVGAAVALATSMASTAGATNGTLVVSPTAPASSTASNASSGLIDSTFCDLVGTKNVQAAGLSLLGYFTKKKISATGIYTASVLTSISLLCKPIMNYAVPALARFLGLAPRPTRAPTRSDYATSFGTTNATNVAQQLQSVGWNYAPSQVNRLTGQLCDAAIRGISPLGVLRSWFPGGVLSSLHGLNSVIAYAATCSPTPTAAQLGFLTSSVTSYLTDNTYPRDWTPPVTMLFRPTETLQSNGLVQVNIKWSSYDFGGQIADQNLSIGTNGHWYPLTSGVAHVARGQRYNLATRARDAAGNWSAWVFTPIYQARTF